MAREKYARCPYCGCEIRVEKGKFVNHPHAEWLNLTLAHAGRKFESCRGYGKEVKNGNKP